MLPKITLSFICAGVLGIVAVCQPVIQSSDLPSTSINMQMFAVTNAGSSDPTVNGANVTWDFSSAQLQMMGMAFMGAAAATPHGAQYPTANWALTMDFFGLGQSYSYFRSTSSLFELLADGVPDDTDNYTDAKQLLQFPFNYQNSFTDTYQKEGNSPATVTWSYTGYGTVISSLGTVQNVVKTVSSEGDAVFWRTSPLHPYIIMDGSGIVVLSSGAVGLDENTSSARAMAFPNPANDQLHISGQQAGDQYVLLDAIGRTVKQGRFTTGEIHMLEVVDLAPGNYNLRVWNDHTATVLKVTKR